MLVPLRTRRRPKLGGTRYSMKVAYSSTRSMDATALPLASIKFRGVLVLPVQVVPPSHCTSHNTQCMRMLFNLL